MSEELFVLQSAPTLAGIKTGSLFNVGFMEYEIIIGKIREFNRLLTPKGIRVIPLRKKDNRLLIYVYRPERLQIDFKDAQALAILESLNYPVFNLNQCIVHLVRRLKESGEFPHEIGLFLGYPVEDVIGFMQNKARDYKVVGTWKVYGNEKEATRKFMCYKRCTRDYCIRIKKGYSLDQLVVTP